MIYTRNQLENMSDHDINLAVAEKIGINYRVSYGRVMEFIGCTPDGNGDIDQDFSPCKDLCCAIEIAQNNLMSIVFLDIGAIVIEHLNDIEIENENPCRAICEVFLMMDLEK